MLTSMDKCFMVETVVKELSNVLPTSMKTYSIPEWNLVVWDTLVLPHGHEKPPKDEFEAKLQELIDAQPWKELREERNKRLTRCDWVATKAFTTDTPIPDEWKTYMQALRDLPANTADPENPVWPQAPE